MKSVLNKLRLHTNTPYARIRRKILLESTINLGTSPFKSKTAYAQCSEENKNNNPEKRDQNFKEHLIWVKNERDENTKCRK